MNSRKRFILAGLFLATSLLFFIPLATRANPPAAGKHRQARTTGKNTAHITLTDAVGTTFRVVTLPTQLPKISDRYSHVPGACGARRQDRDGRSGSCQSRLD